MSAKLPVVGSTAATTTFVHARIDGPGGLHLFIDGNQKVTAGNGDYASPQPNAFSLLQVSDCPHHTPTCAKACYVWNLEKAQPDLHALYAHNSKTIREIVDSCDSLEWEFTLADWIDENAPGGFRWHVSGDIFSERYARFIASVVDASPDVRHWIYTRSFPLAKPLLDVCTEFGGGLALNLSCDRDNYAAARAFRDEHGAGRLCYLAVEGDTVPDDLEEGSVIFPDYALRPKGFATVKDSPFWNALSPRLRKMVCPVDSFGKSEAVRCGLERCSKCLE